MEIIAIAFILAVAIFVISGFNTTRRESTNFQGVSSIKTSYSWKMNKKCLLAILPLFLILGACFTSIPAGHTGVLVTFGKVESQVLSEGVNFKLPYQDVVKVDNRIQKQAFALEAFSADIQQTNVIGSINFTVDRAESQNLYREVGVNYYSTVIEPRLLENVKLVFSNYSAEGLIENRTMLSRAVADQLQEDLKKYGIDVTSVNIEDIDFTGAFTDAVEAKQVAQQKKLTTQTEQEAALIVADAEAERKIIAAKADAAEQKIRADAEAYATEVAAEAEAKANELVAASITNSLIEYKRIEQWDGSVPQVQSGSGSTMYPIIDMTR